MSMKQSSPYIGANASVMFCDVHQDGQQIKLSGLPHLHNKTS